MGDHRERFAELNRRARQAFLAGATEEWMRVDRRHGLGPNLLEVPSSLRVSGAKHRSAPDVDVADRGR